jgi:hypothetical protein
MKRAVSAASWSEMNCPGGRSADLSESADFGDASRLFSTGVWISSVWTTRLAMRCLRTVFTSLWKTGGGL